MELLPDISAPRRNIPRILRPFIPQLDDLFPGLNFSEMNVLRKLASLEGYQLLNTNIPRRPSSVDDEKGTSEPLHTPLSWELQGQRLPLARTFSYIDRVPIHAAQESDIITNMMI